jgi:hypothetical protein
VIPEIKSILKSKKGLKNKGFLSPREAKLSFLLQCHSPGEGSPISQEGLDLLPAPLLVLWVCGQNIENP